MLYVPRHLSNKLEYKVLCCISVHYQSRMTSNGIANTPSRFHSAVRQGKIVEDACFMQDSDGGRKHRTCVCCMQGVCGGFGTRRPSNQEAFREVASRGPLSLLLF